MVEAQPGKRAHERPNGVQALIAKSRSAARFVVILEKTRTLAVEFESRAEASAHIADARVANFVVKLLVVDVGESQVEQARLGSPIAFGQQDQFGHGRVRFGPEFLPRSRPISQQPSPHVLENVGELEHGHVATDAVAMARDFAKHVDHRRAHRGLKIIELHHVFPRREVGVPAKRYKAAAVISIARREYGGLLGTVDDESHPYKVW